METTQGDEPSLVVELSVTAVADGAVVILVDLSDSVAVTAHDLRRLQKLLQVIPREWRAFFGKIGRMSGAGCVGSTVGEIVDGALDLEKLYLNEESVGQGLGSGSFLGAALRSVSLPDIASRHSSTLLLVVTDGRIHDIGRVTLPNGVRCVGLGAGALVDRERWHEAVPGSELVESSRPDVFAVVRRHAGVVFLGPCTIEVPGVSYRIRSALASTGQRADVVSGPSRWDFTLGNARIEIPAAAAGSLDQITVRSDVGACVALPLSRARVSAALRAPELGPVAACHVAELPRGAIAALQQAMNELISQRQSWQDSDDRLGIRVPDGVSELVLCPDGRPRFDAIVVIVPDEPTDQDPASLPTAWLPIKRDEGLELASSLEGVFPAAFTALRSISLMFHRFDARWTIHHAANSRIISLPPRGGCEVDAEVAMLDGRRCRVFFSGPLRRSS